MEAPNVPRRLAAILAADVVGYSRLTGVDEEGTLARLRGLRYELVNPAITNHRGRVVKTTGDGILIEFASVVDAMRCALDVQRGMPPRNASLAPEKRIEFRVGINVGDVVVEGDDLLGEAVNVAARLEGIAEAGGICISEDAYRQVRGKVDTAFVDLGEQALKNIARPVRAYRVEIGAREPSRSPAATQGEPDRPILSLPDKPSIAVLPFANMSGDPEQDYFADGVVEDIITALSRIKWMFVIARNSTFVFKGKPIDVKQVGRELGVRYVLEGSVRKATNRVRITGQLIDATTGTHIWADRFEGALENIFELQDQVTASVVGAIEPAMRAADMLRAQPKPTSSLDAYDYYLRALAAFHRTTRSDIADALAMCRAAIAIDQRYASAYGLAAWCCLRRRTHGWAERPEEERLTAVEFARCAIDFGANDPEALWMAGVTLPYFVGDVDRAEDVVRRSLALNQNSALAWGCLGFVQCYSGSGEAAIASFERGIRQSPLDPEAFTNKCGMAWAYFVEGRYDEAVQWANRALHEQAHFMASLRVKAAACGLLGRREDAEETVRAASAIDPEASIAKWLKITPLKRPDHKSAFAEGLRRAGLRE
ncbi:MAG TPA: adenylate/guanylate cyclase domain-containing protein [Stellaceae bacterium]|nr:adenylate/guanylate cyclase domain-containing protein [Stellaceae bacterium]